MKREEDWLRLACEQLAQEEAAALESSVTRWEARQADEMYRRHRRKILALIRRVTPGPSRVSLALRIAAALLVIAGGVYLSTRQNTPENLHLVNPPTASLAPYYSPVPTDIPAPTFSPVPTDSPVPTASAAPVFSPVPSAAAELEEWDESSTNQDINAEIVRETPTAEALPTETNTPAPTSTPRLTRVPTPAFSPSPTPSPTPTPLPDAPPTPAPAPTEEPLMLGPAALAIPADWQGGYFPLALPAQGSPAFESGDGWQRLAWRMDEEEWVFTEYEQDDVVDVPEDAAVSYIQWGDVVALRMEDAAGVILAWVQDGQSLSLRGSGDGLEAIAESVKKITR